MLKKFIGIFITVTIGTVLQVIKTRQWEGLETCGKFVGSAFQSKIKSKMDSIIQSIIQSRVQSQVWYFPKYMRSCVIIALVFSMHAEN